ncbi:MAG TPA: M28 family peptidase [Thermoanaerobaculia bacterium]|jgi:hypothetical protein
MWTVGVLLPLLLVTAFLARPGGARIAPMEPARLETHVRKLCEEFTPRDESHPENLDRAATYIFRELRNAGGEMEEQPFEMNGTVYRNVIARFGPETRERIVVGAHYDAAGPFPGADDNASGIAGLIELAGLLGKSKLPTRVELVAYTLEEPPWFASPAMGSAVHAASLKKRGIPVRAMISLEMIGYFSDAPGSQQFPLPFLKLFYPSRGNFIAVVGKLGQGGLVRRVKKAMRRASPLPVESISAPPSLPGVDFSDHRNYWAAGYQAVMITDTAFYRNLNYHTEDDTPETLDYGRMGMVVEGVYGAVVALAE